MDPGTILGVVSLTIQNIEICVKHFKRFQDYKHALHGIPDALEECEARLVLLKQVVQRSLDEDRRGGPFVSQAHMRATYAQIAKHVRKLDAIVKDLQKTPGDGLRKLLATSTRSLRKEKEIDEIQQSLSRAVIDLTLGHVDNLKLPLGHVCVDKASTVVHPVAKSPLAKSYGLPPNHISKFVGRNQTLSDLKTELLKDPSRTTAISLWGTGGQGKTQVALELAHDVEVQATYAPLLWINASSRSALGEQFGKFAEQMVRPGAVFADLQSKIDFVEATLEGHPKPCLFVFDNFAASFESSQHAEFLPRHRPYAIMYISRHFDATFPGVSVMVPALPSDDAVDLLLERSGCSKTPEQIKNAERIVSRLGCLPLATSQAGAWLRSSKLPLSKFLHRFNLYIAFALEQPGHITQSIRNVFTT